MGRNLEEVRDYFGTTGCFLFHRLVHQIWRKKPLGIPLKSLGKNFYGLSKLRAISDQLSLKNTQIFDVTGIIWNQWKSSWIEEAFLKDELSKIWQMTHQKKDNNLKIWSISFLSRFHPGISLFWRKQRSAFLHFSMHKCIIASIQQIVHS